MSASRIPPQALFEAAGRASPSRLPLLYILGDDWDLSGQFGLTTRIEGDVAYVGTAEQFANRFEYLLDEIDALSLLNFEDKFIAARCRRLLSDLITQFCPRGPEPVVLRSHVAYWTDKCIATTFKHGDIKTRCKPDLDEFEYGQPVRLGFDAMNDREITLDASRLYWKAPEGCVAEHTGFIKLSESRRIERGSEVLAVSHHQALGIGAMSNDFMPSLRNGLLPAEGEVLHSLFSDDSRSRCLLGSRTPLPDTAGQWKPVGQILNVQHVKLSKFLNTEDGIEGSEISLTLERDTGRLVEIGTARRNFFGPPNWFAESEIGQWTQKNL